MSKELSEINKGKNQLKEQVKNVSMRFIETCGCLVAHEKMAPDS